MENFTRREMATVLAALRYYQFDLDNDPFRVSRVMPIASEGGIPLTARQIDKLCRTINLSPTKREKHGKEISRDIRQPRNSVLRVNNQRNKRMESR